MANYWLKHVYIKGEYFEGEGGLLDIGFLVL